MRKPGARRHGSVAPRPRTASAESSSQSDNTAGAAYHYDRLRILPPPRSSSQPRSSAASTRSHPPSSSDSRERPEVLYIQVGTPPARPNPYARRQSTRAREGGQDLRHPLSSWPARQSSQQITAANSPKYQSRPSPPSLGSSSKAPVLPNLPFSSGQRRGSTLYESGLDFQALSLRTASLSQDRQRSQQSNDGSISQQGASPTSVRSSSISRQSAASRQARDPSTPRLNKETTSTGAPIQLRHSNKSISSRSPSVTSNPRGGIGEARGRSRDRADTLAGASFLHLDDDMDTDDVSTPLLQRPSHETLPRVPPHAQHGGRNFGNLVDRLLARPTSKADAFFLTAFLCIYRKFEAPPKLLEAIIERFKALGEEDPMSLTCIDARLRHLSVLENWLSEYPGDLSSKEIQADLNRFIAELHKIPHFAANALQLSRCLENRSIDDDALWAKDGKLLSKPATRPSSKQGPVTPTNSNQAECDAEDDQLSGSSRASSGLHTLDGSHRSSHTSIDDIAGGPVHRAMLRVEQWKSFMLLPERTIADQLTLMDWSYFSRIKARDLVRHVSLSPEQRQRTRNLENVTGIISHFNQVALWVGHMILFRDKPKHRAEALEKFMKIAKKLRKSNNYSSLGAIIAGINGNAIHRLAQTRELVDPQIAKEYQKWDILMSTHKGYSAYRLAFENSPKERIPFLPVHRRDLVAAEEGNPTFLDEAKTQINWRKFEIIGGILSSVTRCHEFPYRDLTPSYEIQSLLQRTVVASSEDELWERSIKLEEPNGASNESKKKFAWLSR